MGRLKRHYETGYSYLITTVIYDRKPIFFDERNCRILSATIEFFKLVLDYKLFAFCIMPDHLHLILQTYGKYNISYIMKMIKGNFARKYNKMLSIEGKVWQERFYDQGLRSADMLLEKIEYIHNNPVRAKLVASPGEYPFSSYNYYFGNNYPGIPEIDKLEL
jgi:putative transposase